MFHVIGACKGISLKWNFELCSIVSKVIALCSWGSGDAEDLQRVKGRALVGVQGAKPPEDLEILHFTVPRRGQKTTPFTCVLSIKSAVKLIYEKRKICSTRFHNFRQCYIFIISQLSLTSHQRSTVVLLDTGTHGTSREI